MEDEAEQLKLQFLRQIDHCLQSIEVKIDRVSDDVHDLKVHMSSVEEGLAGANRRPDRLEFRVDRIERRLDRAEVSH